MMKKILPVIALLLIVACVTVPSDDVAEQTPTIDAETKTGVVEVSENNGVNVEAKDFGADVVSEKNVPVKRVKEGALIKFNRLKATDPDGDYLIFSFQDPLNERGEWQTGPGDAGVYETIISVTDGKNTTKQLVRIIIEDLNEAPVIEGIKTDISLREGEVLNLNPRVTDADGDEVNVRFEGWQTEFPYTLTYTDAGVHTITVVASDGTNTVERIVNVKVENANRPPILHAFDEIIVTEKEKLTIKADADDADGDALTFTYGAPLDANGQWETKVGDVGTYNAKVTVSDGKAVDSATLKIKVLPFNQPPTMNKIEDITVKEGETLKVFVEVEDQDGDNVTIKFSGWMLGSEKTVGYDEAGEHMVTVTISDSFHEVKQTFKVVVTNVNRPPQFVKDSFN